jgi:hypothetical protein
MRLPISLQRIALAVLAATGTVLAAEPQFLDAGQVRTLITGNSIQSRDATTDSTFWVYFNPNGRRSALQNQGEYELPWRVLDDGTHCVLTGTGDDCARVRRNQDGTWSRVREGKAVVDWLTIRPGKSLGASAPAPGLYLRRRSPSDLEFVLVSRSAMDERTAQARILAAAVSACEGLRPVAGKYEFESSQRVDAGGQGTFQFTQQVSCTADAVPAVPTVPAVAAARLPTLSSPEQAREIEAVIRGKSEDYFRQIAAGNIDQVYAQTSPSIGVDEATWKTSKRSLQAVLGELVRISITRVTVYDNPADALEPGLYVAADYTNEFSNAPLHCGYLMWFRPIGGDFRVHREEAGHVTAAQYQAMPAAQHDRIREQMRCRSP